MEKNIRRKALLLPRATASRAPASLLYVIYYSKYSVKVHNQDILRLKLYYISRNRDCNF